MNNKAEVSLPKGLNPNTVLIPIYHIFCVESHFIFKNCECHATLEHFYGIFPNLKLFDASYTWYHWFPIFYLG
jgi:hypothetical protein